MALEAVPCMSMAPAGAVSFIELQAALPAHLQASFAAWAHEQQAHMALAQQQHQAQLAQQAAQAQQEQEARQGLLQQAQQQRVPEDDEGDATMGHLFQNVAAESQQEPDDAALQSALAQAQGTPQSGASLGVSPTQPFGPALSAFRARQERACPYAEQHDKPSS